MSRASSRAAQAAVETGVVADLTHEAQGVVRAAPSAEAGGGAGKVAFVAGALPGERIGFRRVRPNWSRCWSHRRIA